MNGPISISVTTTSSRKPGGRANGSSGPTITACDQCYRCKVRCSGEKPTCERCRAQSSACTYSTGKPLGKPKGSKNKVQRTASLDITRTAKLANSPEKAKDDIAVKSNSLKRKSEEELKPSKRMSFSSPGSDRPHHISVQQGMPPIVAPDGPALLPLQDVKQDASRLLDPVPFTIDSTSSLDAVFDHSISPSIRNGFHPDTGGGFPSEDMHFDIDDDFRWITQADAYATSSPAQSYEPLTSIHFTPMNSSNVDSIPAATPAAAISISVPDPAPPYQPVTPSPTTASTFTSPGQQQLCVCDPLALQIIAELYTIQRSLKSSQLDHALLLAHRGLTTVSSYLSCPSCQISGSSPRSPSLLFACVLILQQVFSCYGTLRSLGNKLLEKDQKGGFSIGDFEVQGEESCSGILEAIVKAEMERGKGVIGGLERWAEDVETGGLATEKPAGALLRALREEIGAA